MIAVACPICDTLIELESVHQDTVVCPECGEEWRVTEDEPPQLVYAHDMDDEPALDQDEDHPRQTSA